MPWTFKEPYKIYTAETNLEAHMIVTMLTTIGIPALVEGDTSGASLWAFGTISQYHQPNVWIEKSTAVTAAQLIRQFEDKKWERANPIEDGSTIKVKCEECEKESLFPTSQIGTTQQCPHCRAYLDVGELNWEEDFGDPE